MKRAQVERSYGGISAAERRTERRRKLLAAGRQLWGESGVAEVTVRAVCASAGLTSRYFYEQFSSRDELLFAISDDVRDQLLAALVSAGVGDPGTLADKVRSGLTAFLDILAADPHIHSIATGDVSGVAGLAQHRLRILEMITESIVEHAPAILQADTPGPADLRRGARFMVGGVNQLIEAWLEDPQESSGELAAVCADLCVAVARYSAPRAAAE